MSPTYPLPLECLQLIIQHVARRADGNTLVALLCVNKYVCSISLPILYKNPCYIRSLNEVTDPKSMSTINGVMEMIRVLLLSLPDGHVTELFRKAYLPSQPDHVIIPSIPYYSLVTDLSSEARTLNNASIFSNPIIENRLGLESMTDDEIKARYLTGEVYWRFGHKTGRKTVSGTSNTIGQELRRQLVFELLSAGAEYLQSVDIPLTNISAYLPFVPRLKCLVNVRFLLDRQLHHELYRFTTPSEKLTVKKHEDERLDPIYWSYPKHQCVVGKDYCRGFNITRFFIKLEDTRTFLHRCRSLQDIDIPSWDNDLFRWAVDEHKLYRAIVANGGEPDQKPIPLKSVAIYFPEKTFGYQINDVMFAFGGTLESILVEDSWREQVAG
ncbi:hypothetical protein FBU30_007233 [Linnemannia zychae]|nr:hypothetical protein FBU30_007233 [Linnemannia zychae]